MLGVDNILNIKYYTYECGLKGKIRIGFRNVREKSKNLKTRIKRSALGQYNRELF